MNGHSVLRTEDVKRKYNKIDLQFYRFFYCVRDRSVFFYNPLQIKIGNILSLLYQGCWEEYPVGGALEIWGRKSRLKNGLGKNIKL